jgi:hypothetical protein
MNVIRRLYNPVTVNYLGLFMPVPPNITHMATDANGDLYGFTDKPEVADSRRFWRSNGIVILLANVDLEGRDWTTTLVTL